VLGGACEYGGHGVELHRDRLALRGEAAHTLTSTPCAEILAQVCGRGNISGVSRPTTCGSSAVLSPGSMMVDTSAPKAFTKLGVAAGGADTALRSCRLEVLGVTDAGRSSSLGSSFIATRCQ